MPETEAPIRVLVIEDNPGDFDLFDYLTSAAKTPYELTGAGSLAEGFAHLEKEVVDVVVLDLHLPDGQGLETVEKFRAQVTDLPVVVLTSVEDVETGVLALKAGAQDFLTKGKITSQIATRALRHAIERHRTLSELREAKRKLEEANNQLQRTDSSVAGDAPTKGDQEGQVAELTRSNKELEQFAHVAAHDMHEPLRMVQSYLGILSTEYADQLDGQAQKYIGYAADGAARMQRLISDLLAFSRIGTCKPLLQPTSAEESLQRVLQNLAVAIKESGATITHDPLPILRIDEVQLDQLLQNLIGNAIKFHGEAPPKVHLSADQRGQSAVLSVKDNGIGISTEYSHRIFGAFQRLHTRSRYAGSGLGLATSKRIVERHGGRIWLESTPGEGSTFYCQLPRVLAESEQTPIAWLRCDPLSPLALGLKPMISLGRDPSCDFVLRHPQVSRSQGIISVRDRKLFFRDTSTNGTELNGKPVLRGEEAQLTVGDILLCGPFRVAVRSEESGELLLGKLDRDSTQTIATEGVSAWLLSHIPLRKTLQDLASEQATGTLQVVSDRVEGSLSLLQGKPLSAQLGDLSQGEAIVAMLSLEEGRCTWVPEIQSTTTEVEGDLAALLREAALRSSAPYSSETLQE